MAERAAAQQKVEEEVMAQRAAASVRTPRDVKRRERRARSLRMLDEAASAAATAVAEAGGKGESAREMKRLRKEMELKKEGRAKTSAAGARWRPALAAKGPRGAR